MPNFRKFHVFVYLFITIYRMIMSNAWNEIQAHKRLTEVQKIKTRRLIKTNKQSETQYKRRKAKINSNRQIPVYWLMYFLYHNFTFVTLFFDGVIQNGKTNVILRNTCRLLSCFKRKGKERKRIYIAPFIYNVYLKALRHGSHSFTCKYTMPAFPSYAFTRWRHL